MDYKRIELNLIDDKPSWISIPIEFGWNDGEEENISLILKEDYKKNKGENVAILFGIVLLISSS